MNIPRFDGGETQKNHLENTFSEKRKNYLIIQKILMAILSLCLLLALETTWFSSLLIPFLGKGAPALGLLFMSAVAFTFDSYDGCIAGCISGFMYECLTGTGYMIRPLFFAVMGYAIAILSKKILGQNMPSFVLYAMIASVLDGMASYVVNCLQIGNIVSYHYILYGILPRFLWTIVFAPAIYIPVKCFQKIFDKKS